MIWYLLYPFRGTTEPPIVGPTHPLRRIFSQYGREAARHPVITLLISVALSAILIYPFPFLYTNDFTNGSSNLPHHVWTAAQPFEGDANTPPDVIMRSVWVHGSHMKVLESDVLQAGLEIQDELLGPTVDFDPKHAGKYTKVNNLTDGLTLDMRNSLHVINGLSNHSWFFHSPLLYWSCSSEAIAKDGNIVATVNEGSRRATSVNVTLRHSIVFSGKRFEDHRLVAADALVITLLHKPDSPVGKQWERKSESLANKAAGKWCLYPQDGRVVASQLYEFRFQPLSFQDDLLLGIAYSFTGIYFLHSLTKLRALKSRFGLSVTVVAQIAISIMSSFTICAVFKIDLSKIPREAYPVVVLAVGLENMFRMINAVIMTPSQSPTASRMAEALGQTGHVALAGVAQNLAILWLLGKVVSQGVAAFCIFAAIALTFDFLYLLTFFLAVLSVEVRRTELTDSLNRNAQQPKNKLLSEVPGNNAWIDAILRGDTPMSTRVAGTIVMIGFVLIAQWHFFDKESPLQTLSRLLQLIWADGKPLPSSATRLSINVNQARTPTAWLRLQDHETAREVIQVIKPNAHSYIARVYDPLIFVLEGSDRTPSRQGIQAFLPAAYDFVRHESTRFLMTVFFVIAAVSLFMNYLLWDEEMDVNDHDDRVEDEPLLAMKTLSKGHALDVVMLAASPEGVVVSVGLDRWIRVWDIRQDIKTYLVETHNEDMDVFPILAIAVDDRANWLALLSANGKILLWSIPRQLWGPSIKVEAKRRSPISFHFTTTKKDAISLIRLVQASGLMTEIAINPDETCGVNEVQICKGTLTCAHQMLETSPVTMSQPLLVTTSRRGRVHIARQLRAGWISEEIDLCWPEEDKRVLSVVPIHTLRSFLTIRQQAVDLIALDTRMIVHTFPSIRSEPKSVRCFYSTRRKPQHGSSSLASFSLAYTECESGDCIVQTYCPQREDEVFYIDANKCPKDQPSCSWDSATVQIHRMESPGEWEALPAGVTVGVRKRQSSGSLSKVSEYSGPALPFSGLRQRGHPLKRPTTPLKMEDWDTWEAWLLSAKGERLAIPLSMNETDSPSCHLLVSRCGPMTRVGQRSIAVGLGNVIKVIMVGNEKFSIEESSDEVASAISGRRRKPVATKKQSCSLS